MYTISIVRVSVQVRGRAKQYPYHELRIVRHLIGGKYYANSKGATILRRSGPRRGTRRLEAKWRQELPALQQALLSVTQ